VGSQAGVGNVSGLMEQAQTTGDFEFLPRMLRTEQGQLDARWGEKGTARVIRQCQVPPFLDIEGDGAAAIETMHGVCLPRAY
jgi:hypothetical protein